MSEHGQEQSLEQSQEVKKPNIRITALSKDKLVVLKQFQKEGCFATMTAAATFLLAAKLDEVKVRKNSVADKTTPMTLAGKIKARRD